MAEHSQQACEILELQQIAQVRSALELQERKNQIKRLMKNLDQGKAGWIKTLYSYMTYIYMYIIYDIGK